MSVSGRRSFNFHNDQVDVAAGSLEMIAFTKKKKILILKHATN